MRSRQSFPFFLASLLCLLGPGMQMPLLAAEEPPVLLPKFQVIANLFRYHYDGTFKKGIQRVRITFLTPNTRLSRAGVQAGDELVAIDGQSVLGMKREDFEAVMHRAAQPDHPKTITIVGKRGFLNLSKVRFDITFTANPPSPPPPGTQ